MYIRSMDGWMDVQYVYGVLDIDDGVKSEQLMAMHVWTRICSE